MVKIKPRKGTWYARIQWWENGEYNDWRRSLFTKSKVEALLRQKEIQRYESDIKNKKLSVSSPLARGLINKTVDDVVEINSPKGQKSYTIKSVKYI